MMTQTVLPFKCDTTDEKLTAHGGLALFGEFLQAMHLPRQLDEALPGPESRVGYHPSKFVQPLLLMLHGAGRALEDLRQIREDTGWSRTMVSLSKNAIRSSGNGAATRRKFCGRQKSFGRKRC